jgi:hypothetical protein
MKRKDFFRQESATNTCNPSYLGDRDEENCGSKSTPVNQFSRPYLGKKSQKKG